MEAGVISAAGTPEAAENMSQAVATVGGMIIPFFGWLRKEKEVNWTVSTNIEELSNKKGTIVRLVITQKRENKDG